MVYPPCRRHTSVIPVRTAFCLLTVNNMFPLSLMKSILNTDKHDGYHAGSKVHGLLSPPSGSVIKIVLVINVYTAPILFQNQLLSSATQMNLEMHMLKQLPHLLLLILKGQGLYLRFS